ncbi:MAG: alginate lyase family protein [Brevundimonas sp.]
MPRAVIAGAALGLSLLLADADCAEAGPAPACEGADGYAASFDGRRTFLWRPDRLEAARRSSQSPSGDAAARDALLAQAEAALERGPYSVVDKTHLPASGDRHDYMSMGPYWWPNPDTPDGLPYVRRDGETNPERATDAFDLSDLEAMSSDVATLALANYYTGDARYAAKAAELLRVWFLDPATRMNPNLNHGQAVPGRVSGRAEGVIDTYRLSRVVEAIGLLQATDALSTEEHQALRDWFGELVIWMAQSPIGRAERAKANNHGLYYDKLISHFALFAGLEDVARHVLAEAGDRRLAAQIAPDGSMPHELERTRSLHYTAWTLDAAYDMADLAGCVGVDLWRFETPDGRSLRRATDFLAVWAGREDDWPWPEINPETHELYQVLLRAAWTWDDAELGDAAALYADRHRTLEVNLRLPPFAR